MKRITFHQSDDFLTGVLFWKASSSLHSISTYDLLNRRTSRVIFICLPKVFFL